LGEVLVRSAPTALHNVVVDDFAWILQYHFLDP
jgi:hypothetical protein